MSNTKNITYYGMFKCSAKDVLDYANQNTILLIKRFRTLGANRKDCTVTMYG